MELIRLQGQLGNKWVEIAKALGRIPLAVAMRWKETLRDAHCRKTGECIFNLLGCELEVMPSCFCACSLALADINNEHIDFHKGTRRIIFYILRNHPRRGSNRAL